MFSYLPTDIIQSILVFVDEYAESRARLNMSLRLLFENCVLMSRVLEKRETRLEYHYMNMLLEDIFCANIGHIEVMEELEAVFESKILMKEVH
jgi:hypothetical protein